MTVFIHTADIAAGNKMADSNNDSSSDDDICDFEKQRMKNIRENLHLLRSLGKTRVYSYVFIVVISILTTVVIIIITIIIIVCIGGTYNYSMLIVRRNMLV